MIALTLRWGLRYFRYTKRPMGSPLAYKQELLFCLDPGLGNEEFGRGGRMLVPLGKADALWFNPKTKSTTVSGLFTFHRY